MELKDKADGRRYDIHLWLNSDEYWAEVEIAEKVITQQGDAQIWHGQVADVARA